MASERTLVKACMECDAERAQVEVVQQDFLARTCTFSSNSKHSINFNWMLVERQILLSLQVMDLEVRVVKLAEEQVRGLHSFGRQDISVELEELHMRMVWAGHLEESRPTVTTHSMLESSPFLSSS
jgi:hypothetical protein